MLVYANGQMNPMSKIPDLWQWCESGLNMHLTPKYISSSIFLLLPTFLSLSNFHQSAFVRYSWSIILFFRCEIRVQIVLHAQKQAQGQPRTHALFTREKYGFIQVFYTDQLQSRKGIWGGRDGRGKQAPLRACLICN